MTECVAEGSKLPPNIQQWVDALRSGKYRKTSGALKRGDCYCCLGVACEISGLGHWTSDEGYLVQGSIASFQLLPDGVKDWLGLSNEVGALTEAVEIGSYRINTLAIANDLRVFTFEQIVDFIEQHWDKLKRVQDEQ